MAEIGRACGRELRYRPVSMEEYAAAMAADGAPDEIVGLMSYLFTEVLDGRNAALGDGVRRALGREPRDFRDYARDTAATGIWSAVPSGRR